MAVGDGVIVGVFVIVGVGATLVQLTVNGSTLIKPAFDPYKLLPVPILISPEQEKLPKLFEDVDPITCCVCPGLTGPFEFGFE